MNIKEVILFTENIARQKHFYCDVLHFELLKETATEIVFKAGQSVLTFRYKDTMKPSHVAFNIPSDAIEDALQWLQERVPILPDGDDLISDFTSWDAKAVYFHDADKNIIEFIARRRINSYSKTPFSADSILSISEMAIAANDIEVIYNKIMAIKPIPIFDGSLERFCALGNDEGLFILVNKRLKKWHPTQEDVFTSDFIIKGDYNFKFINGEIKELL